MWTPGSLVKGSILAPLSQNTEMVGSHSLCPSFSLSTFHKDSLASGVPEFDFQMASKAKPEGSKNTYLKSQDSDNVYFVSGLLFHPMFELASGTLLTTGSLSLGVEALTDLGKS